MTQLAREALAAIGTQLFELWLAPRGEAELDFEREEELLLRAFGRAGGNVVFDSGDLGSFEELGQRIGTFRPHIVHLTGHGATREETA